MVKGVGINASLTLMVTYGLCGITAIWTIWGNLEFFQVS